MSSREDYIECLQKGDLVAFKTSSLEAKMYSGKITKIGSTKVEVETKNGKKYFVNKDNIFWVNNTGKWPNHIMQALKGIDEIEQQNEEVTQNIVIEEKQEVENSSTIIEDANTGIIVDVIEEQSLGEENVDDRGKEEVNIVREIDA